jgi:hypothetical protein
MTWGEWADSDYDTEDKYFVQGTTIYHRDNGMSVCSVVGIGAGPEVSLNEQIKPNGEYTWG